MPMVLTSIPMVRIPLVSSWWSCSKWTENVTLDSTFFSRLKDRIMRVGDCGELLEAVGLLPKDKADRVDPRDMSEVGEEALRVLMWPCPLGVEELGRVKIEDEPSDMIDPWLESRRDVGPDWDWRWAKNSDWRRKKHLLNLEARLPNWLMGFLWKLVDGKFKLVSSRLNQKPESTPPYRPIKRTFSKREAPERRSQFLRMTFLWAVKNKSHL